MFVSDPVSDLPALPFAYFGEDSALDFIRLAVPGFSPERDSEALSAAWEHAAKRAERPTLQSVAYAVRFYRSLIRKGYETESRRGAARMLTGASGGEDAEGGRHGHDSGPVSAAHDVRDDSTAATGWRLLGEAIRSHLIYVAAAPSEDLADTPARYRDRARRFASQMHAEPSELNWWLETLNAIHVTGDNAEIDNRAAEKYGNGVRTPSQRRKTLTDMSYGAAYAIYEAYKCVDPEGATNWLTEMKRNKCGVMGRSGARVARLSNGAQARNSIYSMRAGLGWIGAPVRETEAQRTAKRAESDSLADYMRQLEAGEA